MAQKFTKKLILSSTGRVYWQLGALAKLMGWWYERKNGSHTLPETNRAPENRSSQLERSLPTIHFQVQTVRFSKCIGSFFVGWTTDHFLTLKYSEILHEIVIQYLLSNHEPTGSKQVFGTPVKAKNFTELLPVYFSAHSFFNASLNCFGFGGSRVLPYFRWDSDTHSVLTFLRHASSPEFGRDCRGTQPWRTQPWLHAHDDPNELHLQYHDLWNLDKIWKVWWTGLRKSFYWGCDPWRGCGHGWSWISQNLAKVISRSSESPWNARGSCSWFETVCL